MTFTVVNDEGKEVECEEEWKIIQVILEELQEEANEEDV